MNYLQVGSPGSKSHYFPVSKIPNTLFRTIKIFILDEMTVKGHKHIFDQIISLSLCDIIPLLHNKHHLMRFKDVNVLFNNAFALHMHRNRLVSFHIQTNISKEILLKEFQLEKFL